MGSRSVAEFARLSDRNSLYQAANPAPDILEVSHSLITGQVDPQRESRYGSLKKQFAALFDNAPRKPRQFVPKPLRANLEPLQP